MIVSLQSTVYSLRRRQGFSLIELLVAISIAGTLIALGIANYRGYSQRQSLESVVRSVKSDFRLAQEYASIGKKPTVCDSNSTLSGYRFERVDNQSYKISAVCPPISPNPVIKTANLPSGYTYSLSPTSITFKALSMGLEDFGITGNAYFTINDSLGNSKSISISPKGTIE